MTQENFEFLKNSSDAHEIHVFGKFSYRAGSYGLSKMKRRKFDYEEISHSNDFRNKTFEQVSKELK